MELRQAPGSASPLGLSILYRGSLASCNYDCHYCPFAKRRDSPAQLRADREALQRFCRWIARERARPLAVFFTPWGEALVRNWYREAVLELASLPHVTKVAIQTNLAWSLRWLEAASAPQRLGFWCTFHPTETRRATFAARCRELQARGFSVSAGIVGLKEHFAELLKLRRELPPEIYLWVNASKRAPDYYDSADLELLTAVDPWFPINNRYHATRGGHCGAGETAIAVDGEGTVRRCHFLAAPLGNLYRDPLAEMLAPRVCTASRCGCHIGYAHYSPLELTGVFGEGLLERVPRHFSWEPTAVFTRHEARYGIVADSACAVGEQCAPGSRADP